jgi:hypothetical protein
MNPLPGNIPSHTSPKTALHLAPPRLLRGAFTLSHLTPSHLHTSHYHTFHHTQFTQFTLSHLHACRLLYCLAPPRLLLRGTITPSHRPPAHFTPAHLTHPHLISSHLPAHRRLLYCLAPPRFPRRRKPASHRISLRTSSTSPPPSRPIALSPPSTTPHTALPLDFSTASRRRACCEA